MRKNFKRFSLVFLLIFLIATPVLAQDISIVINNKTIETTDKPYIKEGRTLVPVRLISENLGIQVDWDNTNRQVLLDNGSDKIKLPIEKDYYLLNDQRVSTEISGEIKNDRTFVPVRLIAELFGSKVDWDNDTRTVIIGGRNAVQSTNTFEEAKVVRVVDGDTIVINRGNGEERVRFILVDTPETKHPKKGVEFFGKEASEFTTNQLSGKTIYLQKDVSDTDRYNRLLRYVWIERPRSDDPTEEEIRTKCFNAILLAGGYANISTFPPDIKYVDLFKQLEQEARESNKGLWAGGAVEEVKEEQKQTSNNSKELAHIHANGKIIGNKNSKIFHVPTGRDYDKVHLKNAVFFDTVEEAIAAGYRQAKR